MSKGKVIVAAPVHKILIDRLISDGYTCEMHEHITQSVAPQVIEDSVGIVTSTRLMLDIDLIDKAPHLKWIGRMGSGMEVIDVQYAQSKGIACYGSPEGNCNAVAEHALGMLLALIRRISVSNNEVKNGIWRRNENRGVELEGKTIGIIGFGHTGRALAKKLIGFDMNILAYDKYAENDFPGYVKKCTGLNEIYETADIISFHVPQQPDTYHYFDDIFFNNMKNIFILLNTSRGQVVDLLTLHKGINRGKIIGACLDVFESEPISTLEGERKEAIDELLKHPAVMATPHIAGYTYEALYKMSNVLADRICGNF
jgi:D-3-phosphoglycerate dehydrogenase